MKNMWIIEMGGSPRQDLTQDVRRVLGNSFSIMEVGVLDGLSRKEVESHMVNGQEPQIKTITHEKKEITLSSDWVENKISELITSINPEKHDAILVACDEDYTSISVSSPVFFPSRIFINAISSIVTDKRIAVIFPVEEQIERLGKRWKKLSQNVTFEVSNPFDHAAMISKIKYLNVDFIDYIVLDCFGFTMKHKEEVEDITGLPCILSRAVVLGSMITLL